VWGSSAAGEGVAVGSEAGPGGAPAAAQRRGRTTWAREGAGGRLSGRAVRGGARGWGAFGVVVGSRAHLSYQQAINAFRQHELYALAELMAPVLDIEHHGGAGTWHPAARRASP
jgi:hypothetical protein